MLTEKLMLTLLTLYQSALNQPAQKIINGFILNFQIFTCWLYKSNTLPITALQEVLSFVSVSYPVSQWQAKLPMLFWQKWEHKLWDSHSSISSKCLIMSNGLTVQHFIVTFTGEGFYQFVPFLARTSLSGPI